MRFKIIYEFLTGERVVIKARGKRLYETIREEHLTQRRNEDNETNKHLPLINCETFDTEELICDDLRWEGLFLTPEQVFFRKLWLAEQEERLKRLQRAMRKLTKSQRRLIRQIYYNNMTTEEIAELDGRGVRAVQRHLQRILDYLRSQF